MGIADYLAKITEAAVATKPVIDLIAGLGLITVAVTWFLAVTKRNRERASWRRFKRHVGEWSNRLIETENRHPNELNDDEWRVECEQMLYDARFTPHDINQLLETSVLVAKGITVEKLYSGR